MTRGKPYDNAVLAKQADHDIVFTVLQDDMPVGGMTYRLSTDVKQRIAEPKTKAKKSTKAASRKTAVVRSSRSKKTR